MLQLSKLLGLFPARFFFRQTYEVKNLLFRSLVFKVFRFTETRQVTT